MSTVLSPQTRPPTTVTPPVRGMPPQTAEIIGQAARVRFVPTRILQRELERRRALQSMRRRRVVEQAHREHEAARDRAMVLGALLTR
ncbi:MAG TPA: hypothetical protein H9837_12225 [Candidatus Brachybacterium merdigallinarum]|nr:hypothetical protein [Candidatus Brachybacterium merdigallinarum]